MDETLFGELKRYVEWGEADELALRGLHPVAAPRFAQIADVFYDRILSHDGARKSLTGGESQVGHLRITLQGWLDRLLSGPWDEEYFQARCLIGRRHVRIALPEHYMFGAMNVLRRELNAIIDARYLSEPQALAAARRAVGKILDLELAIMLHTYRDDLLAQQARVERLSTFGQLVGSIGHDLRNPLGVIETSLFILKGRVADDERARKHAERIGEQLQIANGIIANLLDMIRDRPLAKRPVELEPVVSEAARSVKKPAGVRVELEGLAALPGVQGDAVLLRQVFVNLIDNAVQAAAPAGLVRVEARAREGELVEVAVEDSGPGVAEHVRHRMFEPLITTREQGNGLGLALVKRIVERHGGSIVYAPREGAGARFIVSLPTATREPAEPCAST